MDGSSEQTTFSYSPPSSPRSPQSIFNSIREAYTLQISTNETIYLHSMKEVWSKLICKNLRWDDFRTIKACCNSISTSARLAATLMLLPNPSCTNLEIYYSRILDDRMRLLDMIERVG